MSGRGTIKAGTYGGRRYREKVVKKTGEAKQLAKDIKKETRERAPSSKQLRDMPKKATPGTITSGRRQFLGDPILNAGGIRLDDPGSFNQRAINNFILDTGGGRSQQRTLQQPLGRGTETTTQTLAERNRDIQRAVNTMPLVQNQQYLNLIRSEVEQRQRVQLNPDVDFEDFNEQEDIEEEQAVEAGQVDEETGDIDYGTAVPGDFDGADELDDLGFDPFADPEQEEVVVGTDSDEEAEEFGRQLDQAVPREKPSLAEEIERRRRARQQASASLSIPAGERAPSQDKWIGGLRPTTNRPTSFPSDRFERDKKGNIKTKKVKTITGKNKEDNFEIVRPNLTPEAAKLQEGRILDQRYQYGRNIVSAGESRVKKGDLGAQPKTQKYVRDLGEGVKRDPKTRKILTDRQGNPKMENKTLTIAPREKPVEEMWGLSQRGMSRDDDNPEFRNPYEGRRAISDAPKKRATKRREADTKNALYTKEQIAQNPDYLPRGFNPFSYGAGASVFDKKANRDATLVSQGARQYEPDSINRNQTDLATQETTGDEVSDAEFSALKSYEKINNPPMAPMQQIGGREPAMVLAGGAPPMPGTLPPGVDVSDADLLRAYYRSEGQEPDENFIRQQTGYQYNGIETGDPEYKMYQDGVNEASMTGIHRSATRAQQAVVDALPEAHKWTKVDGGRSEGVAFWE